jgi:hypothetical protein
LLVVLVHCSGRTVDAERGQPDRDNCSFVGRSCSAKVVEFGGDVTRGSAVDLQIGIRELSGS